jgi:hypothetical protein
MDLISLLIFVIVIALVWYLLTTYVFPLLPPPFRTVVIVICVLIAIVWLLGLIGVVPMGSIRIGR